MFGKLLQIIIDEEDVTKALMIVNASKSFFTEVRVGNCGWALAPNAWFIRTHINRKHYKNILKEFKKKGVELLPVETGTIEA